MKNLAIVFLWTASLAVGAGIDGTWTSQVANKNNAGQMTLELKSANGAVTGTVTLPGKRRGRSMPITEGKLDGEKFTFTTVMRTKKAENKWHWSGRLKDGQLIGTRTRNAARKGQPFAAKRAN
jgi:hypothetical protein